LKSNVAFSIRIELQDNAGNRTTSSPFQINPVNNTGSYITYSYDFGSNLGCGGACMVNKSAIRQINFFVNYAGSSPFLNVFFMNGLDFSTGGSLPVTYIFLKGYFDKNKDIVTLNWSTSQEKNNDYFEVQKFHDNEREWITIGKVDGKSNSGEVQKYSFSYFEYEYKVHIYRLKQVDKDKSIKYSEVLSLNVEKEDEILKQNFPNPFIDFTEIPVNITVPSMIEIVLTDVSGKELEIIFTGKMNAGYHKIKFENKNLRKGSFFYILKSDGKVKSGKRMVIE
jgi:hypothetical protein